MSWKDFSLWTKMKVCPLLFGCQDKIAEISTKKRKKCFFCISRFPLSVRLLCKQHVQDLALMLWDVGHIHIAFAKVPGSGTWHSSQHSSNEDQGYAEILVIEWRLSNYRFSHCSCAPVWKSSPLQPRNWISYCDPSLFPMLGNHINTSY